MKKIDGKTKSIGGLKDISECRTEKLDEPIQEVSVKVIINGKESQMKLNDFKALLFDDPKKVVKKSFKIDDILTNKKYLVMYGKPMLVEFVEYWTEESVNGKKMRYQKEKVFDVIRRLKTWAGRDYNALYKEHKFQLEKIRQDEYLRKATEQAEKESIMTPEKQKREINKLMRGVFVDVKKL